MRFWNLRQIKYLWGLPGPRRTRLRYIANHLISITWDDGVVGKRDWPDWAYAPEWGVLDKIGRASCRVWGHDPTTDHCCMPDHDYCEICNTRTPGAAPRKSKPISEEET